MSSQKPSPTKLEEGEGLEMTDNPMHFNAESDDASDDSEKKLVKGASVKAFAKQVKKDAAVGVTKGLGSGADAKAGVSAEALSKAVNEGASGALLQRVNIAIGFFQTFGLVGLMTFKWPATFKTFFLSWLDLFNLDFSFLKEYSNEITMWIGLLLPLWLFLFMDCGMFNVRLHLRSEIPDSWKTLFLAVVPIATTYFWFVDLQVLAILIWVFTALVIFKFFYLRKLKHVCSTANENFQLKHQQNQMWYFLFFYTIAYLPGVWGFFKLTNFAPSIYSVGHSYGSLSITGLCFFSEPDNPSKWVPVAMTASGFPYYEKTVIVNLGGGEFYHYELYLYYDPDCDGTSEHMNYWIFDNTKPSTTATNDLDEDSSCEVAGYTSVNPPNGTQTWTLLCDGDWIDTNVTIVVEDDEIFVGKEPNPILVSTILISPIIYILVPLLALGHTGFTVKKFVSEVAKREDISYKESLARIGKEADESVIDMSVVDLSRDCPGYKASIVANLLAPYEEKFWWWKIFLLSEKGALATVIFCKTSSWVPVGIAGSCWLASAYCRPFWDDFEDKLDILTRSTTFVTCLSAALIEGGVLGGGEIFLAIILNFLAGATTLIIVYAIRPDRLLRGAWKAFKEDRRNASIRSGDAGIERMTEAQAAEMSLPDFEKFSKPIRVKLLMKFPDAFEFITSIDDGLEKILFLLKLLDAAAALFLTEGDCKKVPKEEFEKFDEHFRAALLLKFRDAFEFVSSLERTLLVLRMYESETAISHLTESDAAEISKEHFEELDEMLRLQLVEKFSTTLRRYFKFGNKSLRVAGEEWCEDSGKAEVKYGHISCWDVSEVTNMDHLFCANAFFKNGHSYRAAKMFHSDISRWSIDRVKSMKHMFDGAESFNRATIVNWNLRGKNTANMFGFGKPGEETMKKHKPRAITTIMVICPPGVGFGQQIQFLTPQGLPCLAVVPVGCYPGQQFPVLVEEQM
ncbi:hypothetical protein TrST_g3334 [Triparma strigata]|uniref:Uncharacterized protein n=1 Tax=Triparma strigata TaxID=1606541 RepID=A0A9W7AL37_9STRA|nr:hypothetical protein TrST_g3334 [Triparma strigata]